MIANEGELVWFKLTEGDFKIAVDIVDCVYTDVYCQF